MNDLLMDQTNFYWTLPHVQHTLGMTDMCVIFIPGNQRSPFGGVLAHTAEARSYFYYIVSLGG